MRACQDSFKVYYQRRVARIHIGFSRFFRAQRVPKVRNTGLRSVFLHQPAVRDAYARPAYTWLSHSPLHDRKTLANARNGRSYYVNASHRQGDRGRAPSAAIAHHDRLWGRSRRLIISPAHGASVEPQGAELQPRGPPPAASARWPAARSRDAAAEAREAARGSPLLPTTAASWGDPRLYPHLRLTARRMRRRLTCEGRGGCSGTARSVGSMAAERSGS